MHMVSKKDLNKAELETVRMLPHQARLRHGGNHQTNGGRHRVGTNRFFLSQLQGVSLTGNGDSLVSDGECKHYTNPTHTYHFRTREFFSCGS